MSSKLKSLCLFRTIVQTMQIDLYFLYKYRINTKYKKVENVIVLWKGVHVKKQKKRWQTYFFIVNIKCCFCALWLIETLGLLSKLRNIWWKSLTVLRIAYFKQPTQSSILAMFLTNTENLVTLVPIETATKLFWNHYKLRTYNLLLLTCMCELQLRKENTKGMKRFDQYSWQYARLVVPANMSLCKAESFGNKFILM